jgi:hypothetical protein
VFCEQSNQEARCAPEDDFAICDNDIFGELFIDIELGSQPR